MAENRFAKYRPPAAPQMGTGAPNRFSKYKAGQPGMDAPVDPYLAREQAIQGKGDSFAAPGVVADETRNEDLLKSAGSGLASGVAGLAGMAGDAQQATGNIAGFLSHLMGASPETEAMVRKAAAKFAIPIPGFLGRDAPTSADVQGAVEGVTGKFYEPQTTAGKYANTIGQFVPGALMGPGRVVPKLAQGVTSAIASEAAGQAAEGTKYETLARIGGAIAGGIPSARQGNVTKEIAKTAPTQQAVAKAKNAMYRELQGANIVYDSRSFDRTMNAVANKLIADGIFQQDAPRTYGVVKRLAEVVGGRPDYQTLESIRKQTSAILREGPAISNTDKKAAGDILRALDMFAENAPLATNGRVPAGRVSVLQKKAREMAQRDILSRDVDEMLAKAETYQSGLTSGIRNQFSNYLRSKKGAALRKSSPEVYNAFSQVAKGSITSNALNTLGRFGIDLSKAGNIATLIPAAAAGSTYAITGDPEKAAAVAVLGSAAKFAGRKMVANQAELAKKVVLAGRDARKAASARISQNAQAGKLRLIAAGGSGYRTSTDK